MARQYPTLTRNGFLLPERIKASYEGAGEGRRSASWDAPDIGINSINTPALRNLRARSRAAVRNDPYAFTRRINGGLNGAADRQALYARALKVLV